MSSDSDEDQNIRYGTPLDPYEEDEVPSKRKFQQQADQYATDAHGRRRFHGAFTGGFSAGFGNSVGTPEGWAPATFKSSRSDKAQTHSQRPEDFMDEEDRSEFGIAPRYMQTQNEFSGQKRPRQQQFHDGPIPGEPVLQQLVRAVHETAAVKMLRAMGWRPGQGIGDRLTRREKERSKDQHKVYGCYMPPELRQENPAQSDQESSDSEFEYETLFAPDDYEPYVLQRKNDRFGLGYSGLSRHSVLGNLVGEYGDAGSSKSHLVMKDKGKKVSIHGQAFGVGALEADDEDIYAREDMSHYDFAIGAPKEETKKKTTKDKSGNILEGFVKSSKPLPSVPSYPPPALPRNYVPAAAGARRSRFEPSSAPQRDQGLGRHELTAAARGALLGETPVPKISTLTDESTESQNKDDVVAKIVGRNVNFVSSNTSIEKEKPKVIDYKEIAQQNEELDYISIKDSGKELTNVFKPFASNSLKQARYEKYLKDKEAYVAEEDGNTDRLSEWEKNRELVEFEQAAKLYRPLTGVIGDRFTHSTQPDDGSLDPLCAVAKSSANYGLATPEQIEAAKRGLYGVMTRKQTQWRPESLVCKRFNVPDPLTTRVEPQKEDKPKVSYSIFNYLESSVHDKESFAKEQSKFSGSKSLNVEMQKNDKKDVKTQQERATNSVVDNTKPSTSQEATGFNKRLTVAEIFLRESEKDLKEKAKGSEVSETIDKFNKMDLYKSIFLSDSENEDTESQNELNLNNNDKSQSKDMYDFIDKPENKERNTSPPRGIFANLDFDELNSWKRNANKNTSNNETESRINKKDAQNSITQSKSTEQSSSAESAVYGPKIPDNLQTRLGESMDDSKTDAYNIKPMFRSKSERETVDIDSSSSSDSWVEVKSKSKKQKKKKSKKHKSKQKKSKHKHKKKDRY